jgi:hypothetical protein
MQKTGGYCGAVDANPASWFAAKVKTNWRLIPAKVIAASERVSQLFTSIRNDRKTLSSDPTYNYLADSGMLKRRWISKANLWDIIAIKIALRRSRIRPPYRDALLLAAMNELVRTASNVRFGPELYCAQEFQRVNVLRHFQGHVQQMAEDLALARKCSEAEP